MIKGSHVEVLRKPPKWVLNKLADIRQSPYSIGTTIPSLCSPLPSNSSIYFGIRTRNLTRDHIASATVHFINFILSFSLAFLLVTSYFLLTLNMGRNDIAFVNISHPADIRRHRVQASIRRHVMKDIGVSRRKKPRAHVIPLQLRPQPHGVNNDQTEMRVPETFHMAAETTFSSRPSWSLNQSGILGMDLDGQALQLVHFSKFAGPSVCFVWPRNSL
jgi:hypothetical protein